MQSKNKNLPMTLRIALFFILPYDDMSNLSGDFEELYYNKLFTHGRLGAYFWLIWQILISAPGFVFNKFYWGITMLKNYFKTTVRSILKSKLNSAINILGMSVGLAVCFLLLMFIQDELSYDKYNTKADHTFRLIEDDQMYRPPTEAGLLKSKFPEIEESVRLLPRDKKQIKYNDKMFFETKFAYADPALLKVFTFNFLRGDAETALDQPFSIVITDKIAQKYFGNEDPIGKHLNINNENDFIISGIIESMPHNSHFHFDFFATLSNAHDFFGDFIYNWGWANFPTYFLLKPSVDPVALAGKISKQMADLAASQQVVWEPTYSLQNIRDIHLYSKDPRQNMELQGSINYVIIFSSIAIFILLIACFNYINILTANATARMKEVGIKKVIGATRSQLTRQFMLEAIFQFVTAFIIALALILVTLPYFNSFTSKQLAVTDLFISKNMIGIGIILLVTVLIAGGYPARLISSFQPSIILKGMKSFGRTKFNFRRILVTSQFAISIILTISAVIMFRQLDFLYGSNLGYDKEMVIAVDIMDSSDQQKYESLKQNLLRNSNIKMISAADRIPTGELNNYSGFKTDGMDESTSMAIVQTNYDYFQLFKIEPLLGRLFSENMQSDSENAIILNESAVKKLGLDKNPLGKSVYVSWMQEYKTVVGVVKDFYFESLYSEIVPTAFVVKPSEGYRMIIRLAPGNINETLSYIENTWKNYYPDWIFEYQFLDQRYQASYNAEEKTFKLLGYFTFLAIFIATLGLFGLVSLSTKSKIKEIGIRKVLGSPIAKILSLLTMQYIRWVIIGFIIASPIAYYFMNRWLQNFAYQVKISWTDFLIAGCFTLLISIVTVSIQSLKAVKANPVDTLKYE